jgi:hypothetical protein
VIVMDGLREAGAAIGNVGKRVFLKKRRAQAEETLARWLRIVPVPTVTVAKGPKVSAEADVIEGSWRVVDDEEDGDG